MIAPFKLHKIDQGNKSDRIYMVVSVAAEDFSEIKSDTPMVSGEIRIDDNRRISADQRKKAYATIRDIATWQGESPEFMKEYLKYDFMIHTGYDHFSLSDCNKTLAREYISSLIEFAIIHSVPLEDLAIDRTDDISRYLFFCLKHSKCAICGMPGIIEIHNEGEICLCGKHSDERKLNPSKFDEKYKVYLI